MIDTFKTFGLTACATLLVMLTFSASASPREKQAKHDTARHESLSDYQERMANAMGQDRPSAMKKEDLILKPTTKN